MITTSGNINVNKVIRAGVATSYSPNNVSLFIRHEGQQKRFTATSITNASTTSSGLIVFSNVPLWGDGSYSFYITAENNTDLDVNGVGLTKLATGYVKKITNTNTVIV